MWRGEFVSHVESTQKPLRRFLYALCCGDSALADDIAQETYIKAYTSYSSFSGKHEKFKSWVFRIAYNVFLNYKRSERKFCGYEEISGMISHEMTDATFRYQALYAALDSLSDKERISLLLYYMEGYSIKEIAEISGNSTDSVKQYLSRGRAHLRDRLSIK